MRRKGAVSRTPAVGTKVKRAKMLEEFQLAELRKHIRFHSPTPERDDLMVLLSYRAGLRAAEIAKLDLSCLVDVQRRPAKMVTIPTSVGKKGKAREIPMHGHISDALLRFMRRYPDKTYIAFSPVDGRQMTPLATRVWFWRLYRAAGFEGASSHSGRRTFCTVLARRANQFSNSLVDVQRLMGHEDLETTQTYVEPTDEIFSMVNSLGSPM